MLDPHEEGLIRSFILSSKRERFLLFVGNPKRREKQLETLNHFYGLDRRFAHLILPRNQRAEMIHRLLVERGAPDVCHVMGAGELDGQNLPLQDAIDNVVADSNGNFISCIPGKLAYFQNEDLGQRYILER